MTGTPHQVEEGPGPSLGQRARDPVGRPIDVIRELVAETTPVGGGGWLRLGGDDPGKLSGAQTNSSFATWIVRINEERPARIATAQTAHPSQPNARPIATSA